MITHVSAIDGSRPSSNKLHVALWIAQIVLAAMFGMAGVMKSMTPMEELAKSMPAMASVPEWLVRFIGVSELLAALGLILPAATRVRPRLTPLAAGGLVTIMVLAMAFHLSRGEVEAVPVTIALGGLALFVLWGRTKKVPIAPRS